MDNKMKMIAVIACLFPVTAFAANDGSIGTTSTGTSSISLTIPKLIKARGFSDFNLGTYTGVGDLAANKDLNVAVNYGTANRKYSVRATGSGTTGSFTVTNGNGTELAYDAYYNDATGITERTNLQFDANLTEQAGSVKPLSNITLNANLSIEMIETDIQEVDAGAYSGSITLVFSPE